METKIKALDRRCLKPEDFKEAVEILKSGGLVAMPTETVYGLAGDAMDEEAAKKIYAANKSKSLCLRTYRSMGWNLRRLYQNLSVRID